MPNLDVTFSTRLKMGMNMKSVCANLLFVGTLPLFFNTVLS